MSHAVTVSCKVSDASVLKETLETLGLAYEEKGSTITLKEMTEYGINPTFDLKKGSLTMDNMSRHAKVRDSILQNYQVTLANREIIKKGHMLVSRETQKDGSIRLLVNA